MKIITRTARIPGAEKASDRWRTPRPCFDALDREFAFDLDCAADAENRLCPAWLGPGGLAEDALSVRWRAYGRVGWLNMPYSTELIYRFMRHLVEQSREMTIVALHPSDPSAQWWQFTRAAVEIRDIPHRLSYGKPDAQHSVTAMFPSAVTVWRPQSGLVRGEPRRVEWSWLSPEQLEARRAKAAKKYA